MLIFKKVNSKVLSMNNYLQKYAESSYFEKNLKESLNNKNYGVSNSILYDLSISTYDFNYYKRVLVEIFKALQEKPHRWRRIYKGLKLCEYVMKNGCEYFISEVKEKEALIKKLTLFTHLEGLKDKGVGIREISQHIIKLLRDNNYLKNERIEAAKYANICTNIESKPIEKKGFFSYKRKKKNKIKNTYENSKKNITTPQNNKLFNSSSIFDLIEEERNMLNICENENNNKMRKEKRKDDSNSESSRSFNTSSNSSSDDKSTYKSNKKESRKSKLRSLSSRSSKYSRSSASSNSNSRSSCSYSKSSYSSSHKSSRAPSTSDSHSSSHCSSQSNSHSNNSSSSNTSNSSSNFKSSGKIRRNSSIQIRKKLQRKK